MTKTDAASAESPGCVDIRGQVVVATRDIRICSRCKTSCLLPVERHPELACAAVIATGHVSGHRIETARASAALEISVLGSPRDDIDHAADRVGAEQRRARALDDLHALDDFRCDVLYRGAAERAWIDANPVQQDQRMITLGSAQEYGCRLPGPAMAAEIDTCLKAQQFGQVVGQRQLDVLPCDHGDGHCRITDGNLRARRRDDNGIQRLGFGCADCTDKQ